MTRLSQATIAKVSAQVRRPSYRPEQVRNAIVHLGVGNFHRAHQAAYVDDAMCAGDTGWGIVGVSLRSPAMRDALAPQDGLYTLIERGVDGDRARLIAAIRELLVAPEAPETVVARIADAATRIVSLTVTEKGYCRANTGGGLDLRAPEIAHDLREPRRPRSALGILHAAAVRRHRDGSGGFTVLSCDNLSANGTTLRRLLAEFDDALPASAYGGATSRAARRAWVERELAFPDSMVDRIVPHTTDAGRALASSLAGVDDAWPVSTEAFSQWVLEDRFVAGRPDWGAHGVEFVDDVAMWETMKLRLLNAAHSCLAWLGVPAGLETVDAAIAEPALRGFIERLWSIEVIPTLPAQARGRAGEYCVSLLARFANPALAHRTRQIAIDGSQKLPLRLLPSLRARIASGLGFDRLALAVAAWIRFLEGRGESGERYEIDDPLAGRLAALLAGAGPDPRAAVVAVLGVQAVFGTDLRDDPRVVDAVCGALAGLRERGSIGAVRDTMAR